MKIGILGCTGRVGQALVKKLVKDKRHEFIGGASSSANPHIGSDIGEVIGIGPLSRLLVDDPAPLFDIADMVIDFSSVKMLKQHLDLAVAKKVPCVVGVTGLVETHWLALDRAAQSIPVLYAPNMTLGVNLLLAYVEKAARLLNEDYDIEILEAHHRHKADAPSGTALAAGKAAAKGRGRSFDDVARLTHSGPRQRGDIGFAVQRGGEIMGELRVSFVGAGESFSLSHRTFSRDVYAEGAVKAAEWLAQQGVGIYEMQDVLRLRDDDSFFVRG